MLLSDRLLTSLLLTASCEAPVVEQSIAERCIVVPSVIEHIEQTKQWQTTRRKLAPVFP